VADRFQLFRLSLTPRDPDVFTLDYDPPPREAYLQTLFTHDHEFEHRGNPFVYVPAPQQPTPFLLGQIGRPVVREENLPPDQGFAIAHREAWRAAVLALDPRQHDDGQKISFSRDDVLGVPFTVLRSFVKRLNQNDEFAPYHTEVEPIFNPTSFLEFANEHKDQVTLVKFEFVTPKLGSQILFSAGHRSTCPRTRGGSDSSFKTWRCGLI
jgi:hypothetical protein